MSYSELSVEERATIQIGHAQGFSLRKIARLINRSPSTISREVRRNREVCGRYSALAAPQQMSSRKGDGFIYWAHRPLLADSCRLRQAAAAP
jgi:IS30 family transposase